MRTKACKPKQTFTMNNLFNQYSNGVVKYNGRNFEQYDDLLGVKLSKKINWDAATEAALAGVPMKRNVGFGDILDASVNKIANTKNMTQYASALTPMVNNPSYSGDMNYYSNFTIGGSSEQHQVPIVTVVWYSGATSLGPGGSLNSHVSFRIEDTEYNYGAYYRSAEGQDADPVKKELGYFLRVEDSYSRRIKYHRDGVYEISANNIIHTKIENVTIYKLNLDLWQVDAIKAAIEREMPLLVVDEENKKNAVGEDPRFTYYHYVSPEVSIFYEYDWYWHNCTHWFRHILDQALTDQQKAVFKKKIVDVVERPSLEKKKVYVETGDNVYIPSAVKIALDSNYAYYKGSDLVAYYDDGQ